MRYREIDRRSSHVDDEVPESVNYVGPADQISPRLNSFKHREPTVSRRSDTIETSVPDSTVSVRRLFYPDGTSKTEEEIRREALLNEESEIVFKTPLPHRRDFQYWSERFIERQDQYNETKEIRQRHIEVELPDESLISFIGDTHVGHPSTHYDRIHREVETIVSTPHSYAVLLGDLVDGFFFNPAQMEAIEQPPEQFEYMQQLVQYLGDEGKLIAGWAGDHDGWAKRRGLNAYTEFSERARAHYMNGEGYITLNVGDQTYRITAAHRFPGHSMYNNTHSQNRALRFGGAGGSDLVVSGHIHRKGISSQPIVEHGGTGRMAHLISVGPYKENDEYARKLGLSNMTPHHLFGAAARFYAHEHRIETEEDILIAHRDFINSRAGEKRY